MLIPQRDSKTFQVLYTGNDGEEIGLDEVQLLDDPSSERIHELEALLNDPNLYIRYQAILILTAWGFESGIHGAEIMISQGCVDGLNLSPHRITGKDNRFDDLAEAIHLYVLSGGSHNRALNAFKSLLGIYSQHFFESKFKRALLKHADVEISVYLAVAIKNCLQSCKFYQGSQLLPVLAKLEPHNFWAVLPEFRVISGQIPVPAANIAEALRFISTEESSKLLIQYLSHDGVGVALEAQESIDFMRRQAEK